MLVQIPVAEAGEEQELESPAKCARGGGGVGESPR
jgi:hypothetical protein